jgi:hypothetical protein
MGDTENETTPQAALRLSDQKGILHPRRRPDSKTTFGLPIDVFG